MKQWKCTVCGQIFTGDTPPLPCPICGAGESAFVELPPEKGSVTFWRCAVCGQVFEGEKPPASCSICGAGEDAFSKESKIASSFHKDTQDSYVLIGGGVAALEAAKAIRERDSTGVIQMICAEGLAPFSRPSLSDIVSDGRSYEAIRLEDDTFYTENKIELILDSVASEINTEEKYVLLSNQDKLSYSKLLIATGAEPFVPLSHDEAAMPIRTLRSYADAQHLYSYARSKRVLVVGGGVLGVEAALALYERGCKVSIVELADRLMSAQTDSFVSGLLSQKLKAMGIAVYLKDSVKMLYANKAVLAQGDEISADFVLASVGVRSNVALARSAGILVNKGVVIDATMHTDAKDVYAAGDCAELYNKVTGLYSAAAEGGRVAGAVMAGDEVSYTLAPPATSFEGAGLKLMCVGIVSGEHTEELVYTAKDAGVYRKLVFKRGRLVGAILQGELSGAADITNAVSAGMEYKTAQRLI